MGLVKLLYRGDRLLVFWEKWDAPGMVIAELSSQILGSVGATLWQKRIEIEILSDREHFMQLHRFFKLVSSQIREHEVTN